MADFRINVIVNPANAIAGVRQVRRLLNGLEESAQLILSVRNRVAIGQIQQVRRQLDELVARAREFSETPLGLNVTQALANVTRLNSRLNSIEQSVTNLRSRRIDLNINADQSSRELGNLTGNIDRVSRRLRELRNVDIRFNEASARRSLRNIEGDVIRLRDVITTLRDVATGVFAVGLFVDQARGIIGLTDAYITLQNRLRTVTDGTAELAAVTDELFDIANRTRTGIRSTAEVYTRVSLATRELGLSQRETLQFTESLNQAVTLSGSTAIEAEAGLIQLSQGLGSATLQGDELRSVLEQLPVVADVIAESLGVTRSELRQLGSEGRITPQIVIQAFREAREELAVRFNETIITTEQAFIRLNNELIRYAGQLDESIGITETAVRVITSLADNIDILARSLAVVIAFIGARLVAALVASTAAIIAKARANRLAAISERDLAAASLQTAAAETATLRAQQARIATLAGLATSTAAQARVNRLASVNSAALTAATNAQTAATTRLGAAQAVVARNTGILAATGRLAGGIFSLLGGPVGVILTAAAALVIFNDRINVTSDGITDLGDLASATFTVLGERISDFVGEFFSEFTVIPDVVRESFSNIEFSFEDLVRFFASRADNFIGIFLGVFNSIRAIFRGLPAAVAEGVIGALNLLVDAFERRINTIIRAANTVREFFGQNPLDELVLPDITNPFEGRARDLGQTVGEQIQEGLQFSGIEDFIDDVFLEATGNAQERFLEEQDRIRRLNEARDVLDQQNQATEREDRTFVELIDNLRREGDLLLLNNDAREIRQGLLDAERQLRRELTQEEAEEITAILRQNQELARQADIYENLNSSITEYRNTLESANILLDEGRITLEEYNRALRETELGSGIQQLRSDLLPDDSDREIEELRQQLTTRQDLIDQALQAGVISQQEADRLILQSRRQTADAIRDIEVQRFSEQLQAGQQTFASLADLARNYAGEQSRIYRVLFAASKAFAIADASVQIANAIAKAANTPFPANLAAIATVAGQTSRIISTIQGTELGNVQSAGAFQNGGQFTVGGSGNTDSQRVMFQATPGERVTVETPQQVRSSEAAAAGGGQQPVQLQIINVDDESRIEEFISTPRGVNTLVNVMRRNSRSFNGALGRMGSN